MFFRSNCEHLLHVFLLRPLLFPYRGDKTWVLSSACKLVQADSFLPSTLTEEINLNLAALSPNVKDFYQH